MAQFKEFTTAAEEKADGKFPPLKFKLDGHPMTARAPKDGQVALMMARLGRHSSDNDKVAGMIDFFIELFEKDERQYIIGRLSDGDDGFGPEQISDIVVWLMEEWSKRPTK